MCSTEVNDGLTGRQTNELHGAEPFRSCQLKKPAAFYAARAFITVFTRVTHLSLPWTRWIQSTPCHLIISLRSIFNIILPAVPRSSKQSRLRLPTKNPVVYWGCVKNVIVKNFIILGLPLKLLEWLNESVGVGMDGVCITHMPVSILPQIFCW